MKLFMIGTLVALVTVVHMYGGGTQGAAVEEPMLEERGAPCGSHLPCTSNRQCGHNCFCRMDSGYPPVPRCQT
uniref:Putative salivary secreted protein n=1 Tax=Ornithodoros turicata TaxID=34597 RepID=A0A2R5L629_9ACAR